MNNTRNHIESFDRNKRFQLEDDQNLNLWVNEGGTWGVKGTLRLYLGYVQVVADGVKTYQQLFNQLFSLVENYKVSRSTTFSLSVDNYASFTNFTITISSVSLYDFGSVGYDPDTTYVRLAASESLYSRVVFNSNGTISKYYMYSDIPPSGRIFRVTY